jgi:hypothetical protein
MQGVQRQVWGRQPYKAFALVPGCLAAEHTGTATISEGARQPLRLRRLLACTHSPLKAATKGMDLVEENLPQFSR